MLRVWEVPRRLAVKEQERRQPKYLVFACDGVVDGSCIHHDDDVMMEGHFRTRLLPQAMPRPRVEQKGRGGAVTMIKHLCVRVCEVLIVLVSTGDCYLIS